jgi:hypothetical protein
MADVYYDFVYTRNSSAIGATDTSIIVEDVSLFPANAILAKADFWLCIESSLSYPNTFEIVKLTNVDTSTKTLTVVRGQAGTAGIAHSIATYIKGALTSDMVRRARAGLSGTSLPPVDTDLFTVGDRFFHLNETRYYAFTGTAWVPTADIPGGVLALVKLTEAQVQNVDDLREALQNNDTRDQTSEGVEGTMAVQMDELLPLLNMHDVSTQRAGVVLGSVANQLDDLLDAVKSPYVPRTVHADYTAVAGDWVAADCQPGTVHSGTYYYTFDGGSIPAAFDMSAALPAAGIVTDAPSGYSHSLYSGAHGNSQSSTIQLAFTASTAMTLTFWRRSESESNYDWYTFYIDGVQQEHISGTYGWTQKSYPLSVGSHTLKWTFSTDSSSTVGISGYEITGIGPIVDGVLNAGTYTQVNLPSSTLGSTVAVTNTDSAKRVAVNGTGILDALMPGKSALYLADGSNWRRTAPISDQIVSVSSSYTVGTYDQIVVANGTLTVTLPSASATPGKVYTVKNIGSGTVTVTPTSGTVDGAVSGTLSSQYAVARYVSDGTAWWNV